MAQTSFAGLSDATQQARQWVNELARDLCWSEPSAYRLLKAVLHTLRDGLPPAAVAGLAAQLPALVRGIYFEGWEPGKAFTGKRTRQDFIVGVRSRFGYDDDVDFDIAIGAVFKLLDRHMRHGEITQARDSTRESLRQLWPSD